MIDPIQKERELVQKSADLFNELVSLPQQHPADNEDITYAIHTIQRILATRIARYAYPEILRTIPGQPDRVTVPSVVFETTPSKKHRVDWEQVVKWVAAAALVYIIFHFSKYPAP